MAKTFSSLACVPLVVLLALAKGLAGDAPRVVVYDDQPAGEAYRVYEHHHVGLWTDAEKTLSNTDDDAMCWAAACANVLEWSGWGFAPGMRNADQMFKHFQDHFTDGGLSTRYGIRWWFNGEYPPEFAEAQVDVPGGGDFWPQYDVDQYFYVVDQPKKATMNRVDQYLRQGCALTFGMVKVGAKTSHVITCWGFRYDPRCDKRTEPERYYHGVYVTDSDDDKHSDSPPDVLHYYRVWYDASEGYWHLRLARSYGRVDYKIINVYALKEAPVPRNLFEDARREIAAKLTGKKAIDDLLHGAMNDLNTCIQSRCWLDEWRLHAECGQEIFDASSRAAGELRAASALTGMIFRPTFEEIALANVQVVHSAIEDVRRREEKTGHHSLVVASLLEQADDQWAVAEARRGDGKYETAIWHYGNAWKYAEAALAAAYAPTPLPRRRSAFRGASSKPEEYGLSPNYPNPFNAATRVGFRLPERSRVTIVVYNLAGKRIVTLEDSRRPAGVFGLKWNGEDSEGRAVPSGTYLCRMRAVSLETQRQFETTRKWLLLR